MEKKVDSGLKVRDVLSVVWCGAVQVLRNESHFTEESE